jgi:CHAT domain-containing protein
VLLEYSLGDKGSYLWSVTSSGLSLFKLPARDTIEQAALALRTKLIPEKLRSPIAGINVAASGQAERGLGLATSSAPADGAGAYAAAANALYKVVVEPAASDITGKRVLVVADGSLNYVPFEGLVSSTGGADYSSLPYLVKSNEFVYGPSASVIALVRQQGAKASPREILLVADPVFSSEDPRAQMGATALAPAQETRGLALAAAISDVDGEKKAVADTNAAMPKIGRLKGTRTEAEQIVLLSKASGAQAESWLDFNASENNVKTRELKKYGVIHFATHGLLNAERPEFSGLILSLVGNQNVDGFLRTDEIFNLRLGTPLVMLSACETGLGREKRGEGVIGLTRAFMYAGSPTVGVSLWSVADRSTAELMADFYRNRLGRESMSAPGAMRAAQQKMIAGKKYSAPFYWAPFVLVGDWK